MLRKGRNSEVPNSRLPDDAATQPGAGAALPAPPDPESAEDQASPTSTAAADQPTSTPAAPSLEIPHTRTSATYIGVAVGLIILVLILDFIIQNLNDASVHFITLRFRLPVGLLILAAAVAGGIIVLLVSLARVAQLRLMARRHRRGQPTV